MMMPKLREKQKQLVERVGVAHEREGLSPAAARILGMFLVADDTEHTFEEIQSELGLSKSAVSNALNFLLQARSIEYITRPGDRRRYFRSALHHWPDHLSIVFKSKLEIMHILQEVLAQRSQETEEFNHHFAELLDFMRFINREIPLLIDKWKAGRA
jgi:DNA-binding transcriptional regulator GbsR (MarR family)